MEPLLISEILKATKGKLIKGDENDLVKNITIDTRKLNLGDLFIAIKGKLHDGHSFINEALQKGVKTIITEDSKLESETWKTINIIQVQNTTKALGNLAQHYRKRYKPIVVAITGSNGKTTTKEMAAQILARNYRIVVAPASFNNDIGVPLTILQINKETEVLILEMEMNEIGGIKSLCEIALPDIGLITNIGDTHLQFLFTRKGVIQEKSELLDAIAKKGTAILNADDPSVMEMWQGYKFKQYITFSIEKSSDMYASKIINHHENGTEFLLCGKYLTKLRVPGVYNIYNFLGAASIARLLDCKFEDIIAGIDDFKPAPMRMEQINIDGIEIINDAFNANPQSMLAALDSFASFICTGKKIAILGDMLELGQKSTELHRALGEKLPPSINILITVGEQAKFIASGAINAGKKSEDIITCKDHQEAYNKLVDILKNGDKILVKGSRLMKLEEIITKLKDYYGNKTKTG
jgi:UDP-N-acetylmuramoyl-tripeptide--D-alanyl-D-alanine ligase